MTPFSVDVLRNLVSEYNRFIDPLQLLIYIPTLLIFMFLLRGTKQDTSRGVLLLLAAEWALVGSLFFLNIVAPKYWIGIIPGVFYVGAGLFYAAAASRSFPPHFHWRNDRASFVSLSITALGVLGYPGITWLLGRPWVSATTHGLTPGAVALLTLGVLMSGRPAPRIWLMVPPLVVALISPWFVVGWRLWEDAVLLPAGILAFASWVRWRWKLEGAPTKDTIRFDF